MLPRHKGHEKEQEFRRRNSILNRKQGINLLKRLGRSVSQTIGKEEKDAILNRHQKNMTKILV